MNRRKFLKAVAGVGATALLPLAGKAKALVPVAAPAEVPLRVTYQTASVQQWYEVAKDGVTRVRMRRARGRLLLNRSMKTDADGPDVAFVQERMGRCWMSGCPAGGRWVRSRCSYSIPVGNREIEWDVTDMLLPVEDKPC